MIMMKSFMLCGRCSACISFWAKGDLALVDHYMHHYLCPLWALDRTVFPFLSTGGSTFLGRALHVGRSSYQRCPAPSLVQLELTRIIRLLAS